jgi:hypothetical protein
MAEASGSGSELLGAAALPLDDSLGAPTIAALRKVLSALDCAPDLVVHGMEGAPGEEDTRVDRRLLTPAALRALAGAVAAGLASGACQPLSAIAFCHLLPAISGAVALECLLPLLTPSIEDINLDGQPLQLEDARALLAALAALPARRSLIGVSLIGCGVARAALTEGFPAPLLEGLQIFIPEPEPSAEAGSAPGAGQ